MNKSITYLVVFFGSLTAIIVGCAILPADLAATIVCVTMILSIFVVVAIHNIE